MNIKKTREDEARDREAAPKKAGACLQTRRNTTICGDSQLRFHPQARKGALGSVGLKLPLKQERLEARSGKAAQSLELKRKQNWQEWVSGLEAGAGECLVNSTFVSELSSSGI